MRRDAGRQYNLRLHDIIERTQGRWHEILSQLGIETRFLKNKKGPCPLPNCGGRSRFLFDDKEGTGSYSCNECGSGVGIDLVRKLRGWDPKTACAAIDKIISRDALAPALHDVEHDAKKRPRSD